MFRGFQENSHFRISKGFLYSGNFQENVKWIQTESKESHQFLAFEIPLKVQTYYMLQV